MIATSVERDALIEIAGDTAVAELGRIDHPGAAARVEATLAGLRDLSDDELVAAAAAEITSHAVVPSWTTSALISGYSHESVRRAEAAGFDGHCGVHALYSRAWERAYRGAGHRAPRATCRCASHAEHI